MASLFSDEEKARVEAAVKDAEARTEGELVVVVSRRSDDYAEVRALLGFACAMIAAFAAGRVASGIDAVLLVSIAGIVGVLGYLLGGLSPLLRLFAPRSLREAKVDARTKQLFVEEGVMETRGRSGVLIHLSEAEHLVEILADAGIHARVEPGHWAREVEALTAAIAQGSAADGLVESIGRIGALLAETFPRTEPPENQLDDALRER